MNEKTQLFVENARRAVREIDDPAELQKVLRGMIAQTFPTAANKIFEPGERMPMHEFMSRFQKHYCNQNVPAFYGWSVLTSYDAAGDLQVTLEDSRAS